MERSNPEHPETYTPPSSTEQETHFEFDFIMVMAFVYPPVGSFILGLAMAVAAVVSQDDSTGLSRNCLIVSTPVTVGAILLFSIAPDGAAIVSLLSTVMAIFLIGVSVFAEPFQ